MLLDVAFTPNIFVATSFAFIVPGDRIWQPRSVVAVAETAMGGQPDRGYVLSITDGTNIVAQVGADDGGTEPATVTITWTKAPAALSAAGALATSLAPLPDYVLLPGYVIAAEIANPVAGDHWVSAVCWYEYVPSGS